jgi:uncharacterized protein (TIGR00251 family)
MPWIEDHPDGSIVAVWAVPGASRTEIRGIHDGALRVRLATPAEGGKANRELEKLLKSATGARKASLVAGATSRRKTVLLRDIDAARARELLGGGDS